MAYTSGTATDYVDLLDQLQTYLATEGWTVHNFVAGTVSGGGGVCQLEGPGAGPGQRVFVNIETYADSGSAIYSWAVRGATGYTPGAPSGTNPGEDFGANYFNLWQNTIDYWFFVSDRRFIVVAKCSTAYISMHAGFFLPWALPTQYTHPLYIAVDYDSPVTWNYSNSARRMFCDPGINVTGCGRLRRPDGMWVNIMNQNAGSGTNAGRQQAGLTSGGFVWPWHSGQNDQSQSAGDYNDFHCGNGDPSGAIDYMVNTAQNECGLWPAEVMGYNDVSWGELEGVYCPIGVVTPEQIVNANSRTFQCFPNILRNTGNDYFAVEQS